MVALDTNENDVRYLKSIGVQVGDNGCNCWMQLYITWGETWKDHCLTNYLDTSGNDFKSGEYQIFSSPEILGECYLKKVMANLKTNITIWHTGSDGVDIKYWNLNYVDGERQYCQDGHWYDNIDMDNEISCHDIGCPSGYFPEDGDAPQLYWSGWHASKEYCAKECSDRSDCKSFSYGNGRWSNIYDQWRCKLMKNYYPTASNYKDYQFCRKNESICNFVNHSIIYGSEETIGIAQTKEECSLKAKDYDAAATGCIWNHETYTCKLSYGNRHGNGGKNLPYDSCLFNGQTFWPEDAPGKTCKDNKLITEVKSQISCQELCNDDEKCIGISYAKLNNYQTFDWVRNCYICYNDVLIDSLDHELYGSIGFRRRPE